MKLDRSLQEAILPICGSILDKAADSQPKIESLRPSTVLEIHSLASQSMVKLYYSSRTANLTADQLHVIDKRWETSTNEAQSTATTATMLLEIHHVFKTNDISSMIPFMPNC